MTDNETNAGLRLNKALAQAGVCSRRAADELIKQGRVSVNGQTATELGLRVLPGQDSVAVDGKPVDLPAPGASPERFTYLMLHKPVQVMATAKDPQGRTTVLDLLPPSWKNERLYPVGRLDYFSEGLLLLTNDGELTLRLTHPRYHLPKVYHVRLREQPDEKILDLMRSGMTLAEGETLAPAEVALLPGRAVVLEMTLHQGVNRQIRRMCRDLSLTILSLRRVQQGPLSLGSLQPGEARALSPREVAALCAAVGLDG